MPGRSGAYRLKGGILERFVFIRFVTLVLGTGKDQAGETRGEHYLRDSHVAKVIFLANL
jgi:hypothetical protein